MDDTSFDQKAKIRRYRLLGVEGGMFFGSLIGLRGSVMLFDSWETPIRNLVIAVLAFAAIGSLIGYFFIELFKGSLMGVDDGDGSSGGSDGGCGGGCGGS